MTFEFIPASVRGPARGKAGEVGWVRTLAKILQLGCSKPLGSLALPLAPSRVDSFHHTHTHSHPHPSPTLTRLLSTPHNTTTQLPHLPLPPPHCPHIVPLGPHPTPPEFLRPSAS